MKAKDILDVKGRKVYSISEDASVSAAVDELLNHKIGLLVIKNPKGEISGVISERDVVKKIIREKKNTDVIRVRDIMTTKENIVAAGEHDDIQNIMNIMTEKKVRHVPIFKGAELTGVISIGDIVKNLLDMKEYEIRSLIDYISGKYPG